LLFLLSLLAKESGLLLAFLPAVDSLRRRERPASALRASLPFLLAALAWAALRFAAVGSPAGEWSGYPWFAPLAALGFYAGKLLAPFGLSPTVDALPVLTSPGLALAGGVLLIGLSVVIFALGRRENYRPWPLLAAGFLLALLPLLFLPLSASVVSPLAWRFLYLPSFFLLTALMLGLERLARLRPPLRLVLGLLLALFYAIGLLPQVRLYGQGEEGFWLGIKRQEEQSPLARVNIAAALLAKGDLARATVVSRALLDRRGDPLQRIWDVALYENLASFHAGRGETERARFYFDKLQAYEPGLPLSAQLKAAYFQVLAGDRALGLARLEELLAAYPRNHQVLLFAAEAFVAAGDRPRARTLLERDYELFRLPEILGRLRQIQKDFP
jgi:tetratricopeptide (TPR) repeat protein